MTSRPQRLPGGTPESSGGLGRFNATPETDALIALHEVCASAAWGRGVLAHRPYATAEAVLAASDAALARLTDAELTEAMAGHPPIGRPGLGDPVSSREQSGMTRAPDALKEEMRELNLAYQDRFGHVFLICATGLTGDELRDALKARLGNTPRRERETARTELGRINRIRLTRLLDGPYPQRNK